MIVRCCAHSSTRCSAQHWESRARPAWAASTRRAPRRQARRRGRRCRHSTLSWRLRWPLVPRLCRPPYPASPSIRCTDCRVRTCREMHAHVHAHTHPTTTILLHCAPMLLQCHEVPPVPGALLGVPIACFAVSKTGAVCALVEG
jgi:hypothetical protein